MDPLNLSSVNVWLIDKSGRRKLGSFKSTVEAHDWIEDYRASNKLDSDALIGIYAEEGG